MRISIRKKLVLAISSLVVVLFSLVAFLFINEKRVELADDIYLNTLAFSRLTAHQVVEGYDLYLSENSFVYFNREIRRLLNQNEDVSKIQLVSYAGNLVYDSDLDLDKKYEGERLIEDALFINQLRSEYISARDFNDDIFFLKISEEEGIDYVDENEKLINGPQSGTLVDGFLIPADERFSVYFKIDYSNLNKRVEQMVMRIIYLALLGILIGFLLSLSMSKRITRPVKKLVAGARGISEGDFTTRVEIKTGDELEYLGGAFNEMAKDLEASVEAKIYKERVTLELKLATDIQNQIIPDSNNLPKISGIDIAAGIIPAEEIGGDMYDFLPTKDGRLMFYLGDVTGHGVPAGIVSSIASALFYGYSADTDLKNIIINVNRVLKAKTMSNMFMTLCLMEWVPNLNRLRYVSAGHEQIIHYHAADGSVTLTPAGGVALGMLPEISNHVNPVDVDLQSGDFLVVYSDGIPEAWKNEKEKYGMERFMESVKNANAKTAADMKAKILQDVQSFTAGYKQMDDITLIVIKKD